MPTAELALATLCCTGVFPERALCCSRTLRIEEIQKLLTPSAPAPPPIEIAEDEIQNEVNLDDYDKIQRERDQRKLEREQRKAEEARVAAEEAKAAKDRQEAVEKRKRESMDRAAAASLR